MSEDRIRLARGTLVVGEQFGWLSPALCDRAAIRASQEYHIKTHGDGPFTAREFKKYRGGALTLVRFTDAHGKEVEINPDWLAAV